jgi:hypothetical protein
MSSEQPKEYIITEKQLGRVERCYIDDCDGGCPNSYCPIDIAKEVRSRPHPASTDEQCRTRPYPAPEHEDWARTMHVDQDSIDPPQPTIIPCSRPHPAPTDEQCRICSKATERKAREKDNLIATDLDMQIGCSDMLWDDGDEKFKPEAYTELRKVCRKAAESLRSKEEPL